jgi:hypothetical protein
MREGLFLSFSFLIPCIKSKKKIYFLYGGNMKKIAVIFVLAVALSIGNVYADHPKGWGIGIVGGASGAWDGFAFGGSWGLSLKAPQLPIYWGVGLWVVPNNFSLNVTGDYYFIDKVLIPEANLHWFLGLGGVVNFYNYSDSWPGHDYSWWRLWLGARVPIGLSWQPLKFLEVFADVVPSLGLGYYSGYDGWGGYTGKSGGIYFPGGGIGFEIGLRFWL